MAGCATYSVLLQALFMVILCLADVVSDFIVMVQWFIDGEIVWASIILSTIVFAGCVGAITDLHGPTPVVVPFNFCGLGMLVDFLGCNGDLEFAWGRIKLKKIFETGVESIPSGALQMYVALKIYNGEKEYPDNIGCVSIAASIISIGHFAYGFSGIDESATCLQKSIFAMCSMIDFVYRTATFTMLVLVFTDYKYYFLPIMLITYGIYYFCTFQVYWCCWNQEEEELVARTAPLPISLRFLTVLGPLMSSIWSLFSFTGSFYYGLSFTVSWVSYFEICFRYAINSAIAIFVVLNSDLDENLTLLSGVSGALELICFILLYCSGFGSFGNIQKSEEIEKSEETRGGSV